MTRDFYRYDLDTKFTGILYLHCITDIRMEEVSVRSLILFRKICGENFLENTILVSTMWDEAARSNSMRQRFQKNEQKLRNTLWRQFLANGCTLARSYNSKADSDSILRRILDKNPTIPLLQHELVAQGMNQGDTNAGEQLRAETIALEKKFQEQLAAAKMEHKRALDQNNNEMEKLLQEICADYEQKIQSAKDELITLKATLTQYCEKASIDLGLLASKSLSIDSSSY